MLPPDPWSFPDEPVGFDELVGVFDFDAVGVGLLDVVGVGVWLAFGVIVVGSEEWLVMVPESSLPPAVTVTLSPAFAVVVATVAVIVCAALTLSNVQPPSAAFPSAQFVTFRPLAAQSGAAEIVIATSL